MMTVPVVVYFFIVAWQFQEHGIVVQVHAKMWLVLVNPVGWQLLI